MPQYKRPSAAQGRILDERAKAAFLGGEKDGATSDKYVRLTVVVASVLFSWASRHTSHTGTSATA